MDAVHEKIMMMMGNENNGSCTSTTITYTAIIAFPGTKVLPLKPRLYITKGESERVDL